MLFAQASLQKQTFTLNYPANRRFNIPVACTPSIRRLLSSSGGALSVGRFWNAGNDGDTQLFVRVGAMIACDFRYLRGVYPTRLPDRTPTQYLSGCSGTIIRMDERVPPYNCLVMPEIGLTSNSFPIELVASVHLPVTQPIVFSELHTFAENNRIVGQNRVAYSNAVFNLTARLGINLSRKYRRSPIIRPPSDLPSRPPVPEVRRLPPSSGPTPVHRYGPESDRFARASINTPVQLKVYFDLEKAELKPNSFAELNELYHWLLANSTVQIREGHTDLIGDEWENMDLSRRRVVAVKEYLSRRGVASYRVETAYYGESRPLSRNCPPPNYCPENRRVEMVILKR